MSKDKSPTSVHLREDHKDWMDAENINRSALINELIEQYRNGPSQAEFAAKEYRKQQLQTDIAQAQSEIETKQEQLERIESELSELKAEDQQEKREKIETMAEYLTVYELNSADTPQIQESQDVREDLAEKAGCTVDELEAEAIRQYNE